LIENNKLLAKIGGEIISVFQFFRTYL